MNNDQEPALRHVLDRYGLAGATLAALAGGMVNEVYRVEATGESYALKWYTPGLGQRWYEPRLFEGVRNRVEKVCNVQESVRARSIPTPAIVPNEEGSLFTETEAGCFVLSKFIVGHQYPNGKIPGHAAFTMGAMLGRLLDALADIPASVPASLPDPAQAAVQIQHVLALIDLKRRKDGVDDVARQVLTYNLAALGRWSSPLPVQLTQIIHGDYQGANVIFTERGKIAAVIDFDNVGPASRAFEVMRAFSYSFPTGAEEAYDFFAGYLSTSPMSGPEAAACAQLRAYVDLIRLWPLNIRYETPEAYQARWDEFIRPPTGWWEANWERVSERLADIARAPHA